MKAFLRTTWLALVTMFVLSSCEMTMPIAATSNPVGTKVGTASTFGFLWFPPVVGVGNTGIQEAAKNGGITHISTVDFTKSYYVFYTKWTCTVTGE